MRQKRYTWRPATVDDIGRVVRCCNVDDDPDYDCEEYGILEAIEPGDNRRSFLVRNSSGSVPYAFCEVQEDAE